MSAGTVSLRFVNLHHLVLIFVMNCYYCSFTFFLFSFFLCLFSSFLPPSAADMLFAFAYCEIHGHVNKACRCWCKQKPNSFALLVGVVLLVDLQPSRIGERQPR